MRPGARLSTARNPCIVSAVFCWPSSRAADNTMRGYGDMAQMIIDRATETGFFPTAAQSLDETGLTSTIIDDLLLKRLFNGGPQTAGDIADFLAMPFLLILGNLNELRRLHPTHVLGPA